jgi:hypothetical protein
MRLSESVRRCAIGLETFESVTRKATAATAKAFNASWECGERATALARAELRAKAGA